MEELKNYFEALNIEYTEDVNRLIETLREKLFDPNIDEEKRNIINTILNTALNKEIITLDQYMECFKKEAVPIINQQPVQEAQVNAAEATLVQEAQTDAAEATLVQEAQADEKKDKTNKSVCRNKTLGSTLLKSLPGAVIVGGILLGTISVAPITIPYAYALGKLTIIGGTLAGGFVSCKICNRLSKIKLQKINCKCKISKITTDESKEIELEAEKTMTEIRKMLVDPSKDNYRLQISLIKYKNQCELLEKRIDMKKNQKVAKGDKILQSLSILALNSIRKNMQKNLDEANLLLAKAEEKREDPSCLNKLNTKLQEINENISNIRQASISDNTGYLSSEEKSKNVSSYLKLSIKSSGLEFIRNAKIRNIRLTQGVYNFFNIKIRRKFKALASKFDNARHR